MFTFSVHTFAGQHKALVSNTKEDIFAEGGFG